MRKKKKKERKQRKKTKNEIRNIIIKKKIDKIYEDITKEYGKLYRHIPSIHPDDFLLQFHKKYPKKEKGNNTCKKLFEHLDKYTPNEQQKEEKEKEKEEKEKEIERIEKRNDNKQNEQYDGNNFSLRKYKEKCRNEDKDKDYKQSVKYALECFSDVKPVHIEKEYMYAGKTFVVKKKMQKSSASYKRYLNAKNKIQLGGKFKSVDNFIERIKEKKQINTVMKSTEDWEEYKIRHAVDEEKLKSNHTYIEDQIFVENVDRKMFEQKRKKK